MRSSAEPAVRRVTITDDPFAGATPERRTGSTWPAHWVAVADASGRAVADASGRVVAGYRMRFRVDAGVVRLHVSADERYELYLDGQLVDRGPDRGDPDHWRYTTLEVATDGDEHVLAARVWSLGADAPYAQLSAGHGFLLASDTHPELATGVGPWTGSVLGGYATLPKGVAWGAGSGTSLDGREHPWGWEHGAGPDWPATTVLDAAASAAWANDVRPTRLLVPTGLPAQRDDDRRPPRVRFAAPWSGGSTAVVPVRRSDADPAEVDTWRRLLAGGGIVVPARSGRRVLLDFADYVCARPRLTLDGGRGAVVEVRWQESLVDDDGRKGDRDAVEGRFFRAAGTSTAEAADDVPVGDRFVAGGGPQTASPLWWHAGRFVEVVVTTADEPLTIGALAFAETGYPYADRSTFTSDDPVLGRIRDLAFRTLQACSHETTVDCPFYEQLQYAGDARIQCLAAYVTTGDDRLARQAITAFADSRGPRELTTSRYPSAIRQYIPGFSLWWVAMVHDFASWRGDLDLVRSVLPGVRAVLDAHRRNVDDTGLLRPLPGWNFVDWVAGWEGGTPADAQWRPSSIGTLQLAHVATLAAELEEWLGEPASAAVHRDLADRTRAGAEVFWHPERGLYADDLAGTSWSEHAQALAVLAGAEHGAAALQQAVRGGTARTSLYFDHHLFEALGRIDRVDVVLDRLGAWSELLDRGLHTVIEEPEPTRSDCHAWGAHPLFHLVATVLGVRPVAPGAAVVRVTPRLGGLGSIGATIPTPHGPLSVHATAPGADGTPGTLRVEAPAGVRVERAERAVRSPGRRS